MFVKNQFLIMPRKNLKKIERHIATIQIECRREKNKETICLTTVRKIMQLHAAVSLDSRRVAALDVLVNVNLEFQLIL